MKLCLFGGTFDPIHYGHLMMASLAFEEMDLDRLFFLPSGNPPHKKEGEVTLDPWREEMVRRAIKEDPRFELSTYELEKEGPTYSIDTIKFFLNKYPEADWYFLLGGDSLRTLESWYKGEEILEKVKILVVDRPESSQEPITTTIKRYNRAKGIYQISMPQIDLSSSYIRNRVERGKSIDYMVPKKVARFIEEKKMYR